MVFSLCHKNYFLLKKCLFCFVWSVCSPFWSIASVKWLLGALGEEKNIYILYIYSRAARYIACDSHAHLVSRDGSVISRKSPSPVFKWSGI